MSSVFFATFAYFAAFRESDALSGASPGQSRKPAETTLLKGQPANIVIYPALAR
jgi:hypothetical protein